MPTPGTATDLARAVTHTTMVVAVMTPIAEHPSDGDDADGHDDNSVRSGWAAGSPRARR